MNINIVNIINKYIIYMYNFKQKYFILHSFFHKESLPTFVMLSDCILYI